MTRIDNNEKRRCESIVGGEGGKTIAATYRVLRGRRILSRRIILRLFRLTSIPLRRWWILSLATRVGIIVGIAVRARPVRVVVIVGVAGHW